MTDETGWQRKVRQMRERRLAREARDAALGLKPKRKSRRRDAASNYPDQYGPDALYRDNLGESPDY